MLPLLLLLLLLLLLMLTIRYATDTQETPKRHTRDTQHKMY